MSESKRQKVRRLFMEVLELGESERAVVLARECAGDDALRAEVERLLRAEHDAGEFFSSPTAAEAPKLAVNAALSTNETAGALIGRYKLLEQIGEGGMGTIWMAEQREPVKRRVALKIIKLGMDTKQVIARFEAERQALAMMDHPHIAKVLDAGATETGRPYFVMEYIKGIPILEYCDKERLDTKARLALFTSVCHAIQHAHQKGIIHRDIKPSNVLVTLHDGVPVTKVIDFGIAKATNSELTTKTLFTEHRQMIGTPAYMSPEQAEMSGLDIDTRSDVYSLGVLLYELLTGTVPFDTTALIESGYAEMLRAIREDEPHKPSTRISSLGDTGTRTALQRRADINKLSVLLRGDLDWIVMKCLEKDRTRRYDTANGVAADIVRHLRDEPITAGAPSASYKLHKFIKRNRAQVIAASAVLTALLVAIVGSSWGLVEKSRARSAEAVRQLEDDQRSAVETARRTRNAEAVGALLDQCDAALRSGDASKAKIALDAAGRRAAEGGVEDQSGRLEWLRSDLALLAELDAIDQFRWTWTGSRFGDPTQRTRDVLQRFGADPEVVSLEDAVVRVQASAIGDRILSAMDRLLRRDHSQSLRAVLRRVDPDPFRDAFRDAVLADDRTVVSALLQEPAALEQPSEFAAAMGSDLSSDLDRRRQLLELAAFRRPSDIGVLMALQASYELGGKNADDERLRWLQAAVAADPLNSAAYTNLGLSLMNAGQLGEAEACISKALEFDPRNAVAQSNLGGVFERKGQFNEAADCYRKAILLDPKDELPQCNLGLQLAKLGRLDEAIAAYRKAIELAPGDARAYGSLAETLRRSGRSDEAIEMFRKAIVLDPNWADAYHSLGELLVDTGRTDEAIACYRKAVALTPPSAYAHSRLGEELTRKGEYDEAIRWIRKAIEIDPKYDAYASLGDVLRRKGKIDEALVNLRKSVELRPDNPTGHMLLSRALVAKRQFAEAITCARKAVELAPTQFDPIDQLGIALHAAGRMDEAIACFRKAVEIAPSSVNAQHNLGAILCQSGHPDQAIGPYRRAVELDPKIAQGHLDLALALQSSGEDDAALAGFKKAIELDPHLSVAHYNVGNSLQQQHQWDEAIDCYKKTLEIEPNFAEAACNMGMCLQCVGRFAEALKFYKRGHKSGSKRADWSYPSAEWLRTAEIRAALEVKLPDLLAGKIEPEDNEQRLEYAGECQAKKLHVAATRLLTEAFAADPKAADDIDKFHRFDAATCAVLAAAGRGEDASKLDERERARLRKQALDWLRADLVLHTRRAESGDAKERATVQYALHIWQTEPDLSSIRDADAGLASLPVEERSAFEELWVDVAALVAKTAPAEGARR